MRRANKNSSGVAWSAIERFGIQGSQFVVSIILARMLLPSDYGVIAMLSIFIVTATTLVDSGMAQALIQRQQRSERDLTTALIFNFAIALLIYLIIYVSSPLIAQFYNTPELCQVARIFSLVLIINSLGVVQQALITIALDFKRQAFASLSGVALGGAVAIYMAYNGWGVWALVAQQIISDSTRTAIIWIIARWRPHGSFSMESFKTLARFGSGIMASGIIHVIYINLYPLLIGRYFTPSALGLFNRATTIGNLPSSSISTIVERALYPILCERQGCCNEAIETLYRYLRMVCFGVFPAMVALSILARPTIQILLGESWMGVAPLLQIIALAYMWDPIMKLMGSIIKSQGRSKDFLRAEILKKIVGVAILIVSLPFGIEAMAGGLILYALLDSAIVTLFARRIDPERLGYRALFREIAPILTLTAAMAIVVWFVRNVTSTLDAAPQLILPSLAGVVTYLALAKLFRFKEIDNIIKHLTELKL